MPGATTTPTTHDSLEKWIDAIAEGTAAPGGGAVVGVAGALAAALAAMSARLTVGRPAYAAVDAEFRAMIDAADRLRRELVNLGARDAAAYAAVSAVRTLPHATPEEADARRRAMTDAALEAVRIPLEMLRRTIDVAWLARRAAEAGNRNAAPDATVGTLIAVAAAHGAARTVRVNLAGLKRGEMPSDVMDAMEKEAARLEEELAQIHR